MNGAPGVRQGSCLASTRAAMKVVVEADSVILFETRLVQSRIRHFKLAATELSYGREQGTSGVSNFFLKINIAI